MRILDSDVQRYVHVIQDTIEIRSFMDHIHDKHIDVSGIFV